MDYVSIPGSRMAGIGRRVCDESNVGEAGVWRFRIRAGAIECPDAGEVCDTGLTGVCAEGRTQCVADGTVCQEIIEPSGERCDSLDNDCDGMTDEGDGLCGALDICDRGSCIAECFEAGCPEGEMCREDGRCVETACEDVECAPGERCVGGACIDVCEGVICPDGQSCRAGRCRDLCASLECDACTACSDGACIDHCSVVGCPAGQECEEDGICVEAACLGVRCGPGRTCRMGVCVDACMGVVCPESEVCMRGECSPPMSMPVPDAGAMSMPDASPMSDAGGMEDSGPPTPDTDSGALDAGPGGAEGGGCGCAVPGTNHGPARGSLLVGLAFGIALLIRRRRG